MRWRNLPRTSSRCLPCLRPIRCSNRQHHRTDGTADAIANGAGPVTVFVITSFVAFSLHRRRLHAMDTLGQRGQRSLQFVGDGTDATNVFEGFRDTLIR